MSEQTKQNLNQDTAINNTAPQTANVAASDKKVDETVEATQFDPKKAEHGVDFCCGSCGG